MKFNFKIQQYQTDAVDAVVRVFQGQGFHDKISYIRDRGKVKAEPYQMTLGMSDEELEMLTGCTEIEAGAREFFKLGVQAAEILIDQIENPETSIRQTLLSTKIIARASTERA